MRIFAGGREIDLNTNNGKANAGDIKRQAGIPDNRVLIKQTPDGSNTILPKRGEFNVSPSDRFMDLPKAERGGVCV